MHVELSRQQRDLLLQIVDSAIRELGPEIRHTATSSFKDALKDERRELRTVRELLAQETPDRLDVAVGPTATHG